MCNLQFGRYAFGKVKELVFGIWLFRKCNLSWVGKVLLSSAGNPTCVNHPSGATYYSINYSEHLGQNCTDQAFVFGGSGFPRRAMVSLSELLLSNRRLKPYWV